VSEYNINDEINKMFGKTTREEFLSSINETMDTHPDAHLICIIYDEDSGHFEVAGSEIPIPYAIGMINGALDSMMNLWFPEDDEEED